MKLPRVRVTYSSAWGTGTMEAFRVLTFLEMFVRAHNALRRDDQ